MNQARYSWLLAVAFATLAPAFAHAECGDYLTKRGGPAHDKSMPAAPCNGPHCSPAPSSPVMPPAPAPTAVPNYDATLISTLTLVIDAGSKPLIDEPTTRPIRHSDP